MVQFEFSPFAFSVLAQRAESKRKPPFDFGPTLRANSISNWTTAVWFTSLVVHLNVDARASEIPTSKALPVARFPNVLTAEGIGSLASSRRPPRGEVIGKRAAMMTTAAIR